MGIHTDLHARPAHRCTQFWQVATHAPPPRRWIPREANPKNNPSVGWSRRTDGHPKAQDFVPLGTQDGHERTWTYTKCCILVAQIDKKWCPFASHHDQARIHISNGLRMKASRGYVASQSGESWRNVIRSSCVLLACCGTIFLTSYESRKGGDMTCVRASLETPTQGCGATVHIAIPPVFASCSRHSFTQLPINRLASTS